MMLLALAFPQMIDASLDARAKCFNNATDCQKLSRVLSCYENKALAAKCRLSCGECIPGLGDVAKPSTTTPPAPSKDIESFLQRCYVGQGLSHAASASSGEIDASVRVHGHRWIKSMEMSLPYLRNRVTNPRVLHVGDGGSLVPMLMHKFYGIEHQDVMDLPSACRLARYRDEPSGKCRFQLTKDLNASAYEDGPWDHAIRCKPTNDAAGSSFRPWPSVAKGTYDIIFSFEMLEHLTEGPMTFLLNCARALRPGGYLIITTPNGVSFAALERWLRRRSTVHYGAFRDYWAQMDEERPRCAPGDTTCSVFVGHVKEYSTQEIDSAIISSGFAIEHATTFSPYHHTLDFFKKAFAHQAWITGQHRRGEVHFVVGRKVGCSRAHPCRQSIGPLYDMNRCLNSSHVLWQDNVVGPEDPLATRAVLPPCKTYATVDLS